MDAACAALISLERLSAMPEMRRFPGFEDEVAQATEALRETVSGLRNAGIAKQSIRELDFVLPRSAPMDD